MTQDSSPEVRKTGSPGVPTEDNFNYSEKSFGLPVFRTFGL
jgi:hypothetical protein